MNDRVIAWASYKKEKDDLVNFQAVEEKLLRLAVKHTDNWATDILILLKSLKEYFDQGADQVNLFFRQNGIDWKVLSKNGTIKKVGMEVTELFRCRAMLFLEDGDITLIWEHGNC